MVRTQRTTEKLLVAKGIAKQRETLSSAARVHPLSCIPRSIVRTMNFISSLLGRRRDDGASTEPLTTAELLGLRDAALRVGRRWLACCEDDGAVRTLAGPCGRDALEACCAAASHRGTTDDDAIALGARRALESMVLTDCLLYTSPSPRDGLLSRMPSSA